MDHARATDPADRIQEFAIRYQVARLADRGRSPRRPPDDRPQPRPAAVAVAPRPPARPFPRLLPSR